VYCLSDFDMVPDVPIIIGINFYFILHIRSISVVKFFIFCKLLDFFLDHIIIIIIIIIIVNLVASISCLRC